MKRIYAHIGKNDTRQHFDQEELRNSQQAELGTRDKPTYGLWASPFNDKNAYQWESFLATELNENAHKRERALVDSEQTRFEMYLNSRGLTRRQYYKLPADELKEISNEYNSLPPTYTKEEMEEAIRLDRQDVLEYGTNKRNCAFYFQVDQDKILHINNLSDINPYLQYKEEYYLWQINFDKIKADGYDGIELHNASGLRDTVFWSWDVDSIVVWNPDCVTPVDQHIAYIARFSSDIQNDFDKLDPNMDGVRLVNWMLENEDVVQSAIRDGLISFEDVEHAIGKVYNLESIYRGDQDASLTPEYAHRAIEDAQELNKIER